MEFTIYSIGSAAFLEEILNSVAMISGTGQIESLARIGLIVGVFILGFQAVMNNTGIQFQKVLVCLILYLALYGPSGRALIEDVYTGDVAVVDNVPLGPLAVGSMVSNIGYAITNTFEQAFSVPAMTNYGFADPLNTLVHVRKIANNVMSLGSMTGAGANESLMSSWSNYMRECTLVAANNDERALHAMINEDNAIDALKFNSSVYYTKIYDGSDDGIVLTCSQAFDQLNVMTTGKQDAILADIGKGFTSTSAALDASQMEAKLNEALTFVANGVVDARTFAVMSAVLPILEGAPSAKSIDDMQGAAAIMMSQAMQQQNTQWAAEGSMFTRYIRPFMTFFEGFIYAITPLMAFVIVLGGFGIGLVSKYLLILIWMVLWMPILAIVNLYTLNQTQTKIEAITGPFASAGMSFNTMRDMLPILEQQIGVAGMLASSVPALCMFLVYGTSVAASGIAARLNGSDTINEKIASPDVVQPGAGLSMTSNSIHDPVRKTRTTGFDNLVGSLVSGSQLSNTVSSMSSRATSDQNAFSKTLSASMQQSYGDGMSFNEASAIGQAMRGTSAFQNSASAKEAWNQIRSNTNSSEEADAILASSVLSGSLNVSAGKSGSKKSGGNDGGAVKEDKGGASAGAGANLSSSQTDSNIIKDANSNGLSDSKASDLARAANATLANDKSFSLDKVFAESQTLSNMFSNGKTLSEAAQRSVTSSEAYSNADAAMRHGGFSQSTNAMDLAYLLSNNPEGMAALNNAIDYSTDANGNSVRERMNSDLPLFQSGMSGNAAFVAAGLKALSDTGNLDKFLASGIDADRNAGIQGPQVGDIRAEMQELSANNSGLMSGARDFITSGKDSAKAQGEADAKGQFNDGNLNVARKFVGAEAEVKREAGNQALADLAAVGQGITDVNDFRDFGNFVNMIDSYVLKNADERREQFSNDVKLGMDNNLTLEQAQFFAMARGGDLTTESQASFVNNMVGEGFQPDEAQGMMIKLEQAAQSNAPEAYLGAVGVANYGDRPLVVDVGQESLRDADLVRKD